MTKQERAIEAAMRFYREAEAPTESEMEAVMRCVSNHDADTILYLLAIRR